jgi:hypothetical protein
MLDSFDHGREEGEPGDEKASLLDENIEGAGEGCKTGEEEEEFWDRSCLERSMMSELGSPEPVLRSDESPLSSLSVQEPTVGTIEGEDGTPIIDWQCDFLGCDRRFPKRHELKQVLPAPLLS